MNKFKQIITSKAFTISAFAVAAGLLIFSSVGGTQAALTYYSENYASHMEMYDIGVTLMENGEKVSYRDYVPNSDYKWIEASGNLLTKMLAEGEELKLGKVYPEVLAIKNTGMVADNSINTYNRVTIYKYFIDQDGKKVTDLDPALIELNLVNIGTSWIKDEAASTPERTVLYYSKLLNQGETSEPFSDTISVNGGLAAKVKQIKSSEVKNGKTYYTITTVYEYDGVTFCLEATVDAIQEHNAEDAARSIWGREISITDGTLALK